MGTPAYVSLQDPWIPKTIQMAIDIYGANNETVRSGQNMPQMIIGTNIVAGTLHDDGELFVFFLFVCLDLKMLPMAGPSKAEK